jgi:dihydroorotase
MGTDLHSESIIRAMKDQLNVMSIFLFLGMDIPSIIKAASWAPAQAIKREELGNLSVGGIADIAILSMRKAILDSGMLPAISRPEAGSSNVK